MQIDWFTVMVQVLNFLVLVYLLKRFLYKPVLEAIEAREKRIAEELNNASQKEKEAIEERTLLQQKNADFEAHRTQALESLAEDIKTERQRQLDQVRAEVNALQEKLRKSVEEDRQALRQGISHEIQAEVFAIASKTLKDLGSVSLQEKIVEQCIQRIKNLDQAGKTQFIQAFQIGNQPLRISTAFPIPEPQQQALQNALQFLGENPIRVNFQVNPELVSGIEIAAPHYSLSWNLQSYLEDLQKHITGDLDHPNLQDHGRG